MSDLISEIREGNETPLIGIVGATSPNYREYTPKMGEVVGYALRKYIAQRKGSLFTGGVKGVGLDVYRGIVSACQPNEKSEGSKVEEDRFFVLVPTDILLSAIEGEDSKEALYTSYSIPREYEELAKTTKSGELRIVRAGKDMSERRKHLAKVADALVVVNGGLGTLDEALGAIKGRKPVIPIVSTGEVPSLLEAFKRRPNRFRKLVGGMGYSVDNLDRSFIYPVNNALEVISVLENLLYTLA